MTMPSGGGFGGGGSCWLVALAEGLKAVGLTPNNP